MLARENITGGVEVPSQQTLNTFMTPKTQLTLFDETVFKFQLPLLQRRIAVLVSGGLDSSLLYYLVKSLAIQDSRYTVVPYTLERNDGSKRHAQQVIDYVHDKLNIDRIETTYIPISETASERQVSEGISKILKTNNNILYVGLIQTLPEHALNGVPIPFIPIDHDSIKFPFRNLYKTHIVDMIQQLRITELYGLTHSCVYDTSYKCNECNRCNERRWAFQTLDINDK